MKFVKDLEHGVIINIFNTVKNCDGLVHWEPITHWCKFNSCFRLSLSLSLCLFLDMFVNSMTASVIYSMGCPFLFFSAEVSEWDGCFPTRLLHCPTIGALISSTLFGVSGSTLTCTPCVRKVASNSRYSLLLRAGCAEEIWRNPVTMLVLKSCPSRS